MIVVYERKPTKPYVFIIDVDKSVAFLNSVGSNMIEKFFGCVSERNKIDAKSLCMHFN